MLNHPTPILLINVQPENPQALINLLGHKTELELVQIHSSAKALQSLFSRGYAWIMLDEQMAAADDFGLIKAIHTQLPQMPILVVTTAPASADWIHQAYASGAVDVLAKPLEALILKAKTKVYLELYRQRLALNEHDRHMEQVEKLIAERSGRKTAQDQQLRVLLVDDHPANLVALEALLADMESLITVKANSGPEALRAVLRDDFAVILLDVQMPGMDGFETAKLIRANPKTRLMPIIFVTAGMKDWESQAQGYQQGAVDYLIKPLDPTLVRSKVQVFCDLYRQRLALEKHSTYLELLVANRTAELQKSADALSSSRERYRRLAETLELATRAASLGVWDWNVVSNELVWDARMYELYGVPTEQFEGNYKSWLDDVHPDDRQRCDAAIQSALKNEHPYDIEFRICLPDGSVRHIKADGQVVFNAAGQPLRMTGINYDITQRKQAEEEVKQHRDHLLELVDERTASLKAIVDHAADGIITIDDQGKVLSFNTAAETMFGYSAASMLGTNVNRLMPEPYHSHHDAHLKRYRETGEAHILGMGRELIGQRQDGNVFPLYLAISEFQIAGQRRFTGILRDISAQKLLEANLIQAREVAEAANKAKSSFLANMSHELRTPLNAILGFSRLLRHDNNMTESQRKTLDLINRSGENLLNLINDVLDMSKIEAGRLEIENAPFDLHTMLSDIIELVRVRAESKGLKLQLEQQPSFPQFISGDETKLRQAVINLIGNAIKFTEQGTVTLRLSAETIDSNHSHLHIEVQDSGMGISPEDQGLIFEPFIQVGLRNTQKGTGLGLSITRKLVELMGGELTVNSHLGQGACFRINLPAQLAETSISREVNSNQSRVLGLAPGQGECRILIVEDQMENWLLLQRLLQDAGLSVRIAQNGMQGIEEFENWHPQLIWMDIRMPVLDGMETTRRIRRLKGGDKVKIVALTASAFQEEREQIMAAGMDDFVGKPYRPDEIFDCLSRQLGLIFTRSQSLDEPQQEEPSLQREDLALLPGKLRDALRQAAVELDQEKLATLLVLVEHQNPRLAKTITQMVKAYRFADLCLLLEPADQA